MRAKVFLGVSLALGLAAAATAEDQWTLQASTLTYHVSHPLHETEGVSHSARGKGACREGGCDFLIAVPVKSFDSGDSNRDLHMLQVVRGGEFPIVTVRTHLQESRSASETIRADLQIEFAGQTAQFNGLPMQVAVKDDEARISGTIPATLAAFKIDPPTLLAIPIKNEIPIRFEMTWRRQK